MEVVRVIAQDSNSIVLYCRKQLCMAVEVHEIHDGEHDVDILVLIGEIDEGLEQLGMLVIDIFAKHRLLEHETYKNADRRV